MLICPGSDTVDNNKLIQSIHPQKLVNKYPIMRIFQDCKLEEQQNYTTYQFQYSLIQLVQLLQYAVHTLKIFIFQIKYQTVKIKQQASVLDLSPSKHPSSSQIFKKNNKQNAQWVNLLKKNIIMKHFNNNLQLINFVVQSGSGQCQPFQFNHNNNLNYKTGPSCPKIIMLPYSHKPQILRLHTLQEKERNKFVSNFGEAVAEAIPPSFNRAIFNSPFLKGLLSAFPDIYYTLVTVNLCRRRLGEEYTYIAMYKQKHYAEQGVLLNKKTRLLLFLLEIVSRNLIVPLFSKFMQGKDSAFEPPQQDNRKSSNMSFASKLLGLVKPIRQMLGRVLGNAEEIMSNVEWLILMVYMLDWNKHFTVIETLLGVRYAYTYKNDQIKDVSYAIQGYLLLATFIVKAAKHVYSFLRDRKNKSAARAKPPPHSSQNMSSNQKPLAKQKHLCRICYDELKNKSSTKCGHIFCWSCIVKTLEISSECPVCRSPCLPREVVQLKNI